MRNDFWDDVHLNNMWTSAMFMWAVVVAVVVAGYWYYDLSHFCRAMYVVVAGVFLPVFGPLAVLVTKDWIRLRRDVREYRQKRSS